MDELTTELSNLRNQYEELEKINKELLSERELLNGRLNELTAAAEEVCANLYERFFFYNAHLD